MDTTQKFNSDIEKIKKHQRASNPSNYDGLKVCSQITNLFARSNAFLGEAAQAMADYWYSTYIETSENPKEEPTQQNTDRIVAIQALVDGDDSYDVLTEEDYKELCQLVNFNAEDMDLETLNSLMTIFVDHQAL